MIHISGAPGALRDHSIPRPTRWEAVDALRGVVMVLMALDHVRVYSTDTHFSPTDLSRTTAALFFTRWVTHFCAPAFFLLAGLGASLSLRRGKTRSTLPFYLVTRGLWLIVLEVTVVSFAWTFNLTPTMHALGVIWALGCSMVMLAGLVYLPRALIAAFAILLIVGHNLFDDLRTEDLKAWGPLWAILHTGEDIALTSTLTIDPFYPLVPWVGVMALGYALGPMLEKGGPRSRRLLLGLGMMLTAAFVLLRVVNAYGDPEPWSAQPSALVTVLSFLNTTKYPPSLLFLLMTLGPTLMALALFDRTPGLLTRFFIVFGRVPLFFYLVHLYLIHGLAVAAGYVSGFDPRAFLTLFVSFPQEYGFSLPVVYCIWIGVVVMLYPLCRWYGAIKASRRSQGLACL
jgi:uncharacterized membrane protein